MNSQTVAPSILVPESFSGSVEITVPNEAQIKEGITVKAHQEMSTEISDMYWGGNVHRFNLGTGPIRDVVRIWSPNIEDIQLDYWGKGRAWWLSAFSGDGHTRFTIFT